MSRSKPLRDAFLRGFSRRSREEPSDWARKHVILPRSTDSTRFRPEFTPWWKEPMREGADNANSIITMLAPIGSGKSTMVEAFTCWAIDQKPGPMMIIGQTDSDVCEWAETGLVPALRKCAPIAAKIPVKRHGLTKEKILIDGMPIHLTGANLSGLQSKSELWVVGDEAWMYRDGMVRELKGRTHRRWNARVFLMGQGGALDMGEDGVPVGCEFAVECYLGEQREWMFACPQCGDVQPYARKQIKFPDEGSIPERAAECVYECANCAVQFDDTSKTRRAFAKSARYEVIRESKMPRQLHFHLNAWALWRAPWSETLTKYLLAQEAKVNGNPKPLEQYMQKEEAEHYQETVDALDIDYGEEPYSRHDYWPEDGAPIPRWEEEVFREMKIDVQDERSKVPYWVRIRTWRVNGDSRLLYEGGLRSIEEVRRLQERFDVPNENVGIDVGYQIDRVATYIARFKAENGAQWWGMRGDQKESYMHKGKVSKPYSPIKRYRSSDGHIIRYFFWSNLVCKDVLASLIAGQREFGIPHDHSRDYGMHMEAEAREEVRPGVHQWVKKRKRNDQLDNEAAGVAHAMVRGVLQWDV